MRPELDLIETIEKYLKGKMNDAEKAEFEKRLKHDTKLRREVNLQQDIMNGIERAAMKQKIVKAYNKYMGGKNFLKWGSLGTGIIAVTAAVLFYTAKHNSSSNSFMQHLPELNEQGTKQWSDADKYLPGQSFILNTSQDTVIQTTGGMVLAVPANCFLDEDGKPVSGPIELEVKEALDPASMMKAGLSTKSGNRLLESAGMFYLNARLPSGQGRKDGKSLKINPNNGIYVHVPADTVKSGMQAFEGKRMPDGTIDWVNPKPLVHNLVTVNIHTLNFYPPLYLDSLAYWGKDVKNKKYTDSLYYSFAGLFNSSLGLKDSTCFNAYKGVELFRANCAMCHSAGNNKIVGPGLEGVTGRVPQPYESWLLKYIKNNRAILKSGDAYANKVDKENNGTAMTIFDGVLTDKQINDIIQFLADSRPQKDTRHLTPDTLKRMSFSEADSAPAAICGINPAKIKAIWSDEFQNTIIATREFEARMPYIHKTGQEVILDLYVNNLDKNLSYIDSLAAQYLSGDMRTVFLSFAARGDGKVAVKSKMLEKLKSFYENKARLFTEATAKAKQAFLVQQNNLDSVSNDKENKDIGRASQMRGNEYKINLKEACRQVGDPDSVGIVDKNGYAVLCTGTGWVNIDAYVWESTLNRTTLNYTSPVNGKKAVIRYLPFSVTINDYKKYDNVFVYLLPSKLNSFMRLEDTNGTFKERLDELFTYKMECVAFKGKKAFYNSIDAVEPRAYNAIILQEISMNELNKKLAESGNQSQKDDMAKEVEYMQFQIEDKKRRKKNEEIADLTNKVKKVIFPCYVEQPQQADQQPQQGGIGN